MDISYIVKKLIKRHKTRNPFELADRLNINVKQWPLHSDIKGIYQYYKRNKFIYINQSLPYSEQKLVCSHEIGHAVLHGNQNISFLEGNTFFVKNRFEIEANKFAAELLIPDDILQKYPGYFSIEQIASAENIYPELLKLKFNLSF